MLNIDMQDNPSVDALERQVRLLITEGENELRCDNVSPARGFNYHMTRIAQYIVKREISFVLLDQVLDDSDFSMVIRSTEESAGPNGIHVFEHAELLNNRPTWRQAISDFAKAGNKVVYKNYRI